MPRRRSKRVNKAIRRQIAASRARRERARIRKRVELVTARLQQGTAVTKVMGPFEFGGFQSAALELLTFSPRSSAMIDDIGISDEKG